MPACLHARELSSSGIFFAEVHQGRVTSGSTKTGSRNKREREREGAALHEVCCRAMLKIHTKFFFGLGGGVDPHQIAVTLNWIFNVSAEPVIEFLLSVAHDIYQKSATTNQNQQQP